MLSWIKNSKRLEVLHLVKSSLRLRNLETQGCHDESSGRVRDVVLQKNPSNILDPKRTNEEVLRRLLQTIMQGKVKGKRRLGCKNLSWLRNIRNWTGANRRGVHMATGSIS